MPFPRGTRLINLGEELDEGDQGERYTPAGSLWTVEDVWDEYRRIICENTGGAILPTVRELYRQYTGSLRGWHWGEAARARVVVSASFATCPSALVKEPCGEIVRVPRDVILKSCSPPGMTYSPRLRRYVHLYAVPSQLSGAA